MVLVNKGLQSTTCNVGTVVTLLQRQLNCTFHTGWCHANLLCWACIYTTHKGHSNLIW